MPLQAEWVDRECPLCASADTSHVFAEANIDLSKLDGFAFASRKLPEYMHPRLIECSGCGILYGSRERVLRCGYLFTHTFFEIRQIRHGDL